MTLILLIASFICALVATFSVPTGRVSMLALAFALYVLTLIPISH